MRRASSRAGLLARAGRSLLGRPASQAKAEEPSRMRLISGGLASSALFLSFLLVVNERSLSVRCSNSLSTSDITRTPEGASHLVEFIEGQVIERPASELLAQVHCHHEQQDASSPAHTSRTNNATNNNESRHQATARVHRIERRHNRLIRETAPTERLVSHNPSARRMYTNQFVIKVEGGPEQARKLAQKHGFAYLDQILGDYHHLEHRRLSKRAALERPFANLSLQDEPQVLMIERQLLRRRVKRDFLDLEAPTQAEAANQISTTTTRDERSPLSLYNSPSDSITSATQQQPHRSANGSPAPPTQGGVHAHARRPSATQTWPANQAPAPALGRPTPNQSHAMSSSARLNNNKQPAGQAAAAGGGSRWSPGHAPPEGSAARGLLVAGASNVSYSRANITHHQPHPRPNKQQQPATSTHNPHEFLIASESSHQTPAFQSLVPPAANHTHEPAAADNSANFKQRVMANHAPLVGNPSNSSGQSTNKSAPFNDPSWSQMWYLDAGAKNGFDLNVMAAWRMGYTGKGIVITILDDGLEKDHPDLQANYDPLASFDINGDDADPMPRYDALDSNRHGTRCAGEVAAVPDNNICSIGIAYNSKVGGVRMLDGEVTDAVEARSLGLNNQHIHIYSASWGPDDNGKTVDGPGELATKAFMEGVTNGRQGLGSIFVFASGNGGREHDNCNCDGYTNSIWTLSISSATENGLVPWYIESCSSTLATTYSSGSFDERQIATTDLHHSCTSFHTGTSASAPLAAGICALVLESNPRLTWRDMQHIVVRTAKPANLIARDWRTNGLGRNVSHAFGYGLMDAAAMINLAQLWTTVPEQYSCEISSPSMDKFIPARGSIELKLSAKCPTIRFLEHVQSKVTLTSSRRGDLHIYLVSPHGTRSTLLAQRPNDNTDAGFKSWPFMSVHNWGESPNGIWTLEVHNDGKPQNRAYLKEWTLILYGTQDDPNWHLDSRYGSLAPPAGLLNNHIVPPPSRPVTTNQANNNNQHSNANSNQISNVNSPNNNNKNNNNNQLIPNVQTTTQQTNILSSSPPPPLTGNESLKNKQQQTSSPNSFINSTNTNHHHHQHIPPPTTTTTLASYMSTFKPQPMTTLAPKLVVYPTTEQTPPILSPISSNKQNQINSNNDQQQFSQNEPTAKADFDVVLAAQYNNNNNNNNNSPQTTTSSSTTTTSSNYHNDPVQSTTPTTPTQTLSNWQIESLNSNSNINNNNNNHNNDNQTSGLDQSSSFSGMKPPVGAVENQQPDSSHFNGPDRRPLRPTTQAPTMSINSNEIEGNHIDQSNQNNNKLGQATKDYRSTNANNQTSLLIDDSSSSSINQNHNLVGSSDHIMNQFHPHESVSTTTPRAKQQASSSVEANTKISFSSKLEHFCLMISIILIGQMTFKYQFRLCQ